jgi:tripartite-type tricarboxylate transporter receptor subunit TctC
MQLRFLSSALSSWVLGACVAALAGSAFAQQGYPSRTVRFIAPLAPGGPSDILARTLAQLIAPGLGQPVVVENRTGAGGTIGADAVAKSPADGHTMLLMAVSTYTINASLYKKLPFDPRKDLTPVSVLASATYILAVHPSLPVTSLQQLVAFAKARPGDLNYASGGAGTGPQMAMELLKLNTGMSITHVPYKGQGAALVDIIAGQVHMSMINMIGTLQFVQSGRLRALAVTGGTRFRALPGVPTLEESGIPGFKEIAGHMVMVPSGTPPDIIARLNREIVKALQTPEVRGRLESEGADIIGNTPEQAAAIVRADIAKWAEVIRKTGITAN